MIESCRKEIEEICNTLQMKEKKILGCDTDLKILEDLLNDILKTSEALVPNKVMNRTRRFAVSGTIALDAAAIAVASSIYNKFKNDKISKMIEQTHANDEYLLNLIKNQTTIAEDLHKILKTQKETIDFQMSQAYMGEVSQPRGGIPKFFFF